MINIESDYNKFANIAIIANQDTSQFLHTPLSKLMIERRDAARFYLQGDNDLKENMLYLIEQYNNKIKQVLGLW